MRRQWRGRLGSSGTSFGFCSDLWEQQPANQVDPRRELRAAFFRIRQHAARGDVPAVERRRVIVKKRGPSAASAPSPSYLRYTE